MGPSKQVVLLTHPFMEERGGAASAAYAPIICCSCPLSMAPEERTFWPAGDGGAGCERSSSEELEERGVICCFDGRRLSQQNISALAEGG